MKQFSKFVTHAAVLVFATSGLVVVGTQSANAVGGNCSSSRQTDGALGPDNHRVKAQCSSLQGDSKARGILDRNGDPDKRTAWFTALNKSYYSDYAKCILSCNNTRVEVAHV